MPVLIDGSFSSTRRKPVPFKDSLKQSHLLFYRINSIQSQKLEEIKKNQNIVPQNLWNEISDPMTWITKNKDTIKQHVERRFQLFFLQLICCYNTPFHFKCVTAEDQYGNGRKVTLKNEISPNTTIKHGTQAAHSSTLPCLHACTRAEWEDPNCINPEYFVYQKYSHAYLQHNGTIEMPTFVNQSDSLIDGTGSQSKLRKSCMIILNDAAKRKCDPRHGMTRFANVFEKALINAINNLGNSDPRRPTLKVYLERIQEFKESLKKSGIFDWLIGIRIGGSSRENILRDLVYKKRFELIQTCANIESQMARLILDAQNTMLSKSNTDIKMIDYRLRYTLLEDRDPRLKRLLERLFCVSLEQLQLAHKYKKTKLRSFEGSSRITSFRNTHARAIRNLKRDLRQKFQEMDKEEFTYRAKLFKGLREEYRGWKGVEFVRKYRARYPKDSMSSSMVSRLEYATRVSFKIYKSPLRERKKDLRIEKAKRVSKVFEIDPGLFLPAIVSSTY